MPFITSVSHKGVLGKCMSAIAVSAVVANTLAAGYGYLPAQGAYPVIRDRRVRIMPFGDSMTAGYNGSLSYRYFLWKTLEAAGYCAADPNDPREGQGIIDFVGSMCGIYDGGDPPIMNWDMDHEGHPQWSSPALSLSIGGWARTYQPDIALLHVGTNDLPYGIQASQTYQTVGAMIDSLRCVNPKIITVVGLIVRNLNDIHMYVPVWDTLKVVASEKNAPSSPVLLVDFTEGFVSEDYRDPVHLGHAGDEKMASRWFEALRPALNAVCGKTLAIYPQSGDLNCNESYDITVALKSLEPVDYCWFYFKGARVFPTTNTGALRDYNGIRVGQTLRIPNIVPAWDMGAGVHQFKVAVRLKNGIQLADSVNWHILHITEP